MDLSIPNTEPRVGAGFQDRAQTAAAWPAWYLWCAALAVTSVNVGGQWDIAWHRSIGRDGLWTAPHLAIYLCGVLAGIACGSLILATTFGDAKIPESSVRIWGFRGPLGAFIASWGGLTMLASAPFDNWWHGAYGLDVKILSPPHVVLMAGGLAVQIGTLILILGEMNRAFGIRAGGEGISSAGTLHHRLEWLFLYVGGMILCSQFTGSMEYTGRPSMHSAMFYRACALAFLPVLVGVARAARTRWAATLTALVYTVFFLALLWILPRFHAEPKLGPVYHPVSTLIPAGFPLLLLAPALALDLAWPRLSRLKVWPLALMTGAIFLIALAAVQWPFGDFLNSPAADNPIFGSGYLDTKAGPTTYLARNLFFPWERSPAQVAAGLAIAALSAVVMARLGLAWGDWMRKVRR
jgi:hypothetical protein